MRPQSCCQATQEPGWHKGIAETLSTHSAEYSGAKAKYALFSGYSTVHREPDTAQACEKHAKYGCFQATQASRQLCIRVQNWHRLSDAHTREHACATSGTTAAWIGYRACHVLDHSQHRKENFAHSLTSEMKRLKTHKYFWFSHRRRGVKILTRRQERTGPFLSCSPFGFMSILRLCVVCGEIFPCFCTELYVRVLQHLCPIVSVVPHPDPAPKKIWWKIHVQHTGYIAWTHLNLPKLTQSHDGVFTLGDARSFSGLTSKIPPLGSVLNFDADVKKTTARHPK